MSTKTIKILYWVLLGLFCLFHVFDAIGGITMAQAGIDAMHAIAYPVYLMPFLAVLKLLGVAALLQNKFTRIKEWAFAGFSFTLIGACVSHCCTDRNPLFIVLPLVFLAILFVIYACWRKLSPIQIRTT
jgi:hypothetical protein